MTTSATPALPEPSSLFGAFADETRLRILNLLSAGELCVCDLCEVLDEIQPKVSRHLATLRRAGLVDVRRQGKWKYYSLAEAPSPLHRSLLGCVHSCLGELEELSRDRERLRALEATLRCG
jgi:ArsR family transcriptional regulator